MNLVNCWLNNVGKRVQTTELSSSTWNKNNIFEILHYLENDQLHMWQCIFYCLNFKYVMSKISPIWWPFSTSSRYVTGACPRSLSAYPQPKVDSIGKVFNLHSTEDRHEATCFRQYQTVSPYQNSCFHSFLQSSIWFFKNSSQLPQFSIVVLREAIFPNNSNA